MAETLLSVSTVLLYGRELADLTLKPVATPGPGPGSGDPGDGSYSNPPARLGGNNFLEAQLIGTPQDPDPNNRLRKARLARIYGFSYEGHYYDLAKPAIFLVHGPGTAAQGPMPGSSL